ncbi:MAG: ROK family protein [Terrimicrobiaceae bacterium]|nr:ROK family protein [Terrimicrobiaceae bacterium]
MRDIYLGTDSGATTSKTCGVYEDGEPISLHVAQSSTRAEDGTEAVVRGWVEGLAKFLEENGLEWRQVRGVGLALPGPFQSYGVLDRTPNLPASFAGWEFHRDYSAAIARVAGREIPLVCGNDGNFGGVGEAARVRGHSKHGVILLAPGSGLGAAYIDDRGLPLEGDTFAGMEGGHMPAPLHLLGLPPFTCGCGRSWGCFEAYTSISGLPQYLELLLPKYPGHSLASSDLPAKQKALSLRGLAQEGDPLALEIFDHQAKALGIHVANLSMALDARYVVIGGGLVDPHATTPEFRERYLRGIREAAFPWLYPMQQKTIQIVPATLGELSQAIGAALMALYSARNG